MNNKVNALQTVQNNFSILNEAPRTHYDSDQEINHYKNNISILNDSRKLLDSNEVTPKRPDTEGKYKNIKPVGGNKSLDQYINSAVWAQTLANQEVNKQRITNTYSVIPKMQ